MVQLISDSMIRLFQAEIVKRTRQAVSLNRFSAILIKGDFTERR